MKPRVVAVVKTRGAVLTYSTTRPKRPEHKPGSLKAFAAKEKR